ncbi:DUF4145 domain-containing protein [Paraferrimonas haliotis]|uniref:DUF4145 domain-containing protein n=1 Tax=Paraferrimonas haliotis TaxID=2013866 RepID=A0AA37TUN1_9GAMM|nr:DUF4145 domain-containing protein [Paraferrimonas haliotis]GLS82091.1 hypothetical protein GCM10007894_00680 [Paraferrimonas haliotis]
MANPITDKQLVQAIVPELQDDYRVAKSYVRDVPTQSLLHLRSLLFKLTDKIASALGKAITTPNLYDRIEELNNQRLINVRLTRRMHKIRADGNRGAHPEKYRLAFDDLVKIAERSVERCAQLLAELYPVLLKQPVPDYQFVDFDSLAGREICYKAIMENHPESQLLVGLSLKTKALEQRKQEFSRAELAKENVVEHQASSSTLKQAGHYFELAHTHLVAAKHEYGVALINGYLGETQLSKGCELIKQAAQSEHSEAMALYGFFLLTGNDAVDIDLTEAQRYLSKAAESGQPEAMANLGVLYYQSGHAASNLEKAFQYTEQAAQAGYPQGQYNLYLMLVNGDGCDADAQAGERWLAEAAEQGHFDAMLARAQHMLSSDDLGHDKELAERYLREVIRYGHSVTAMLELSLGLANGAFGDVDFVKACAWLLEAEHRSQDDASRLASITALKQEYANHIQQLLAQDQADEQLQLALKGLSRG